MGCNLSMCFRDNGVADEGGIRGQIARLAIDSILRNLAEVGSELQYAGPVFKAAGKLYAAIKQAEENDNDRLELGQHVRNFLILFEDLDVETRQSLQRSGMKGYFASVDQAMKLAQTTIRRHEATGCLLQLCMANAAHIDLEQATSRLCLAIQLLGSACSMAVAAATVRAAQGVNFNIPMQIDATFTFEAVTWMAEAARADLRDYAELLQQERELASNRLGEAQQQIQQLRDRLNREAKDAKKERDPLTKKLQDVRSKTKSKDGTIEEQKLRRKNTQDNSTIGDAQPEADKQPIQEDNKYYKLEGNHFSHWPVPENQLPSGCMAVMLDGRDCSKHDKKLEKKRRKRYIIPGTGYVQFCKHHHRTWVPENGTLVDE